MKRIAVCVGARPNYIKMAPVVRAIDDAEDLECVLVDAKQHYSKNMRDIFFEEVGLREPDWILDTGCPGRTQAVQMAKAMTYFEDLLKKNERVDSVLVHGDMNYALGCALAAVKLHIPVIHNEAGLRSFDRRMPEEINRILIDHIATTHFVTEKSAVLNLDRDGICCPCETGSTLPEAIGFLYGGKPLPLEPTPECPAHIPTVGDLLSLKIPRWDCTRNHGNVVATLHRPENVDNKVRFMNCVSELTQINEMTDVRFYCHPRTQARFREIPIAQPIKTQEPVGYREFIEAMLNADLVITDSGGIQEETTILGVPCLTWRISTERPVTCDIGTNRIATGDMAANVETMLVAPDKKPYQLPQYWDGKATQRIIRVLRRMK